MEADRVQPLGIRSLVAMLLVSLWATVAFWSFSERQQVIAARESELDKDAVAIEEQILRRFKLAEASIQAAALWIEQHPTAFPARDPSFIKLAAQFRKVSDDALDIRLVDSAGGFHVVPSPSLQPAANVAGWKGVSLQMNPLTRGLHVGDPVISPEDNRWIVPVTYPVLKPDGELVILAAILQLEEIAKIFELQRDKPNGSITIFKTDGVTLLRTPAIEGAIGKSIATAPDFIQHLSSTDRGHYRVKGVFDGVERLVSHARLQSYPLIVAVTSSLDDALAPWRVGLFKAVAFSLLLTLATMLMAWRSRQAEEESRRKLRESADELRLFAENVPSMIVSFDENLNYRFANRHYADFFGFGLTEIIGKPLREIVGEDTYKEIEGHFAQALNGHPVEYQRTRTLQSGESRYLEVKLVPNVSAAGKSLGCFVLTTDITDHRLAAERIQRVAHHDSLTGLPNRLLFNDRLAQAISLARRGSQQFALLYLDLDKFKPVNDILGHAAGDELLQAVAARIRSQVRESDTVARVGGDEFIVILSDIARRVDAEAVARKIEVALSATFLLGSQGQSVSIGTSIGIAIYPGDGEDADTLVTAADAAMYNAKRASDFVQQRA